MKNLFVYYMVLFSINIIAQNRTVNQEVLIEVKSKSTQKAIANAWVNIKGHANIETDFKGKAFFESIPKGNYKVEINADGFKNYISSNKIKVTDSHNTFVFDLIPLRENSFSIKGRVTDETRNDLSGVEVYLDFEKGSENSTTNDRGYYNFFFNEGEIIFGDKFNLRFRKKGHQSFKEYTGVINENHLEIPTFELKKITEDGTISISPWKELNINYVESFDLLDISNTDNIWNLANNERGWKSYINNGIYSLSSKDPTAVKYIWLDPKNDEEKNAASLEVKLDPHKESLAFTSCGLLLSFDQKTKHYYAYTISKDGEYHLFEKNERGINKIFSGRKSNVNMEEFVTVGAILEETKMSFYINEELIKIHNFSKPLKAIFGVVAIGQGDFYFDNLSIYK